MDNQNPSTKKPFHQKLKPVNDYVKYSGLAFQMAILLLIGYWLGSKADAWVDMGFPVFTIFFILLFLSLSFYSLIKNLPKN